MITSSTGLRFSVPCVYGVLAYASGLLRAEKDALVLDFEVKDAFLDAFRLESSEVRVPFSELGSVTLKKGWFSGTITIRSTTLRALAKVPGAEAGELRLKITRRECGLAEAWVGQVTMTLTHQEVKSLLDGLETSRT